MIKILLVTQQKETGLTYHRQSIPHTHLKNNYEYQVDYTYDITEATKEDLQGYQIVSFLRLVDYKDRVESIIQTCKDAGCKVIVDIDDYWELPKTHELYKAYQDNNIPQQTISGLVDADWVTTTTDHFASKIKEFNKNVTVLPNSIDPTIDQFKNNKTESERVRFGWIGGVYHSPDLRMLYESFQKLWKGKTNDFQLCLGGFNPNEAYLYLERIFTDEYKNPKAKYYIDYLKTLSDKEKHLMDNQPYKRLWGTDVYNYAKLYNDIDVSLVPLQSNPFNHCKSQIKIIEAGFFKKACIVSNTLPYTIDCNKENSILINYTKNNLEWYSAIKHLLHNRNRIEDLGEAMYETVKDKYNINTVNKVRNELYKKICA